MQSKERVFFNQPIHSMSQSGATLISWLLLIAVLGLLAVVGLKLFPIYLKDYTLSSILEDVARNPDSKEMSNAELWSTISKRLSINEIDDLVNKENVTITRDNGRTTIAVKYEARTDLIGNLDGIAVFDHAAVIQ